MFMQTITIEQRLAKAVVAWMSKEPALSGVMMIGERVIQTKIPTACTNGRESSVKHSTMRSYGSS